MCGITGFIGDKKFLPDPIQIKKCLDLMKRRGPDNANHITVNKESYSFTFLHSRLSIIDPYERSNQPMQDNEGLLCFVGEIYNYVELRSLCKKKGIKFKTKSDTEVLLKILNLYQEDGIRLLDGDWAFCYYNKKFDKILISKDRFSVKPLFYKNTKNGFYFSTNIIHLFSLSGEKGRLEYDRIKNYLSFGFRGTELNPNTFFQGVKKFPSGCYSKFVRGKKRYEAYYWTLSVDIDEKITYEDAVEKVKEVFQDSVKLRLRGDSKIGCLLSAGIDSSSIAGIAKKKFNHDLVYVSYRPSNKNYDESNLIDHNKKHLDANHTYVTISGKNNSEECEKIIKDAALPMNAPSDFLYHRLCVELKTKGCKVLLTGSAGDDFFAGNYSDHLNYLVSIYDTPDFPEAYAYWEKKIKPLVRSNELKNFDSYLNKSKIDPNFSWTEKQLVNEYLNFDIPKIDTSYMPTYSSDFFRNKLLKNIFDETVPAHCMTNDHIAMYNSLESRFPFLSHKLYELVCALPSKHFIRKAITKSVLRDAVKDFLPQEILASRNKVGFYMDFKDIFKFEINKFEEILFQNNEFNKYIKTHKIRKILTKEQTNTAELILVFSLFNLSILFQQFD